MASRRDFLKATGAGAALLTARGVWAADATRPNLLIIHTDEHNFRTLGCYRDTLPPAQALMWGKAVVETPHVDWLAKEGALCTSFYATTPVCSPSRAAFVSGRYPQNTPVVTNSIALNDNIVTFAEILRKAGYATGYSGKWHLDGGGKPQWGPKRQFGFADNRYMFNRGHWKKLADGPNGPKVDTGAKPSYDVKGATPKSFTTDFLADKTVDFIHAHKGEPFCYMVSIPDPHGPDTVRPPYDTMYNNQKYATPRTFNKPTANLPSWGRPEGKFSGMSSYYGMVKCIDDNVGKILKTLRATGLIDKTIIVFTADHGDLRGEHHRQNKGVPYEGSAKIPFVIRYPGKIKAGTIVNEALGCVDFQPTILKLMGVKAAGTEQGRDASTLLTTGKAPADWKDISFIRGTSINWLMAVTNRYKLILSPRDLPWLLDYEKDPDEVKNFYGDPAYRETVRELSKELTAYIETYNDPSGKTPRVQADLKWGIEGTGKYTAPDLPAAPAKSGGKRRKKKKE